MTLSVVVVSSEKYSTTYLTDLDFADGIVLLGSSRMLKQLLSISEAAAFSVGLRTNEQRKENRVYFG